MVMFKVTICDIGKMNINMTDKIEKRRQPLQYRTMAMTTTIMSMVRASAAMTAAWNLRRHELCRELQRITSKRATHTRRCSSTTTQTIWVAVVTSPTLTARWCSILSMCLSVKSLLRNATTFGITPYLFNAKEFDEETGMYYYGARYYDPRVSLWISTDILEEKNYGNSSYAYTYNPITFIDPIGTDTINISYVNKKWKIDAPIIADGNDVFNVANGDKKETYEFSQGEHGKRVNLLNLEIGETKDSYTLGVYHISGEADNGTGFYVAPGGEPSTKNGSGRRIPDGTYPIINPTAGSQWIKPGVGGNVSKRGIRFHYGGTNPRSWTEGCFVLSSGYSVNGNTIHYNADESKTASRNFDNALGAIGHFSYRPKSRTYNREGATFNAPIKHTLILKSRKK
jgi:RHS repeat-associated protein